MNPKETLMMNLVVVRLKNYCLIGNTSSPRKLLQFSIFTKELLTTDHTQRESSLPQAKASTPLTWSNVNPGLHLRIYGEYFVRKPGHK